MRRTVAVGPLMFRTHSMKAPVLNEPTTTSAKPVDKPGAGKQHHRLASYENWGCE
jgi:hypothetical protein